MNIIAVKFTLFDENEEYIIATEEVVLTHNMTFRKGENYEFDTGQVGTFDSVTIGPNTLLVDLKPE